MASNYSDKDLSGDDSSRCKSIVDRNHHKRFDMPLSPDAQKEFDQIILQLVSSTSLPIGKLRDLQWCTFSHWPYEKPLSDDHMIRAGFFFCGVGDRVICIYCSLVCEGWTLHTDDPCEVHRTRSPTCAYSVLQLTTNRQPSIINNGGSMENSSVTYLPRYPSIHPVESSGIVCIKTDSPFYEIPTRHASFATWPPVNLPPVDKLARAGFFYTGTNTIVTCFYCNGSLQNWGPNDNPTIEHARWFPNCAYAKQLCGDDLHRKIQESKRAQQEHDRDNGNTAAPNRATDRRQSLVSNENTFSQPTDLLHLPISEALLKQRFQQFAIIRCWEDYLQRKHLKLHQDVLISCFICQKQIEHSEEKKKIVVLNTQMRQIREQNEPQTCAYVN